LAAGNEGARALKLTEKVTRRFGKQVTRHVARPTLRGLFTACAVALLDQRSDKAQELLLLWPAAGRDQKGSDVNVGDLAT
jgi:hypothetical protein